MTVGTPRLSGLVNPHVPFDQPTVLARGIAALGQAGDKVGVLLVRFAVLFAVEQTGSVRRSIAIANAMPVRDPL